METNKVAIIGGGASGFFAAITAAETIRAQGLNTEVHIFESAPHYLQKVKISGGGRCNVTHYQYDITQFTKNYPRGSRELISPLKQFQAEDTVKWFGDRGVRLVAENDGRMFPSTNKSDTIINCFMKAAQKSGVYIHTRSPVITLTKESNDFILCLKGGEKFTAKKVLIATGSTNSGYAMAKSLGHTITELAPSLFSFKINHSLIKGLAGTSFPQSIIKLTIQKQKFQQEGPLLITHWGLSGPAILKLSAFAARELKRAAYQGSLTINWTGLAKQQEVVKLLDQLKQEHAKSLVKNTPPQQLTKRFWNSLLDNSQIPSHKKWIELSKKEQAKLAEALFATSMNISGKNRFKDEFVECGGVSLKEVNFKTMESKITAGLYFSGEILDIDGITGGFNFQNAWTTGHIAGSNLAR